MQPSNDWNPGWQSRVKDRNPKSMTCCNILYITPETCQRYLWGNREITQNLQLSANGRKMLSQSPLILSTIENSTATICICSPFCSTPPPQNLMWVTTPNLIGVSVNKASTSTELATKIPFPTSKHQANYLWHISLSLSLSLSLYIY